MRKLITRDQEIEFNKLRIYPEDLPNNTHDIKLVSDDWLDLGNLNLNIVKYNLNDGKPIHIANCNINKLILNNNNNRSIRIFNSNIQNIYVQSEIYRLYLINTPIPNFHGKVDLIDEITIDQ